MLQTSIPFSSRIHHSSSDLQLRTNMQTNDLQSNDRWAHLYTEKRSNRNKHISVIWKLFQWNKRCFSLEALLGMQLNRSHITEMRIYGWTISYGCAPLNTIEPKLQFLVKRKKNRKKVTRREAQFHIICDSSFLHEYPDIQYMNTQTTNQPSLHIYQIK